MSVDLRLASCLALALGCHDEPAAVLESMETDLAPMLCGRDPQQTILEVNGGGLALFDADGDHDPDLLLVRPGAYPARGTVSGGTNRLYRNDEGRFVDVTRDSGVDVAGWCNGVAVADVDADGDRDVYLTRLGPNVLLVNEGGLRFREAPGAAGAAGDPADWSTSAAFVDVDRDGDMDLYVCNYLLFDPDMPPLSGDGGAPCLWKGRAVLCGPQGLVPQTDRFYVNEGGRFREATAEAGLDATASYGLGVLDLDVQGDGWPDIYVANDSQPNFLFVNRGDGTFEERGLAAGVALSARGREQAGMGLAAGDVEGDGDEDVLVTNFSGEPNALYVALGNGRFSDEADPAGIGGPSRPMLGWGCAFLDLDLDADLDILTSNGHVYPQADDPGTDTRWAQPAEVYANGGGGRFTVLPGPWQEPVHGRALATGDVDLDGITDVVVVQRSGPTLVWRATPAATRALSVALAGPPGNPDGAGAVLTFTDAQGARSARLRANGGFQASCEPLASFAWRGPGELSVVLPDGRTASRAVDAPGRLRWSP